MDDHINQLASRIRREISISEVVGDSIKIGSKRVAVCPFYADSKPALLLNDHDNLWVCWPCGKSGDSIAFYMEAHCVDFSNAVSELANRLVD